jgi:hypothetical protein
VYHYLVWNLGRRRENMETVPFYRERVRDLAVEEANKDRE